MATQGEALATQFEEANSALIAAVQGMSDAQWRTVCSSEGWSVGVVAHHVASSQQAVSGLIVAVANGQTVPPITQDFIDQGNARHAQEAKECTRTETIDLLKSGGADAAAMLRGLSDEQLARTATLLGNEVSAGQIVENILIAHPRNHLASIQAAI